jgi:hypothetical protein
MENEIDLPVGMSQAEYDAALREIASIRTEAKLEASMTVGARLALQRGLCAICGRPPTTTRRNLSPVLDRDHDHKTGYVRGLLCRRCNILVGWLESTDPTVLRKALDYTAFSRSNVLPM